MYESVKDTSRDTAVFFYLSDDDPEEYDRNLPAIVGPNVPLVWKFNLLADDFPGQLMMMMTDDVVFETPSWDERIKEEFRSSRLKCVCPHDGRDDRSRTFWTVSQDWIRAVGYFMPPFFHSFYSDSWVSELAEASGRLVYLPDVVMRHTKTDDETRRSLRTGENRWINARDKDVRIRLQWLFDLQVEKLRQNADLAVVS